MEPDQLHQRYQAHYDSLAQQHGDEKAAELAVGGDFQATGTREYYVLKAHSLTADTVLVAETLRLLKPRGRVVFTFLEFFIYSHDNV